MESDWLSGLNDYFAQTENDPSQGQAAAAQENARDEQFFASVAAPAFQEIKAELEKRGREVSVDSDAHHASIKITYQDHIEFDYALYGRTMRIYPVKTFADRGSSFNAEGSLRSDAKDFTVREMTKNELIQHCLKAYEDSRLMLARNARRKSRS
jgi:hypothetical protein